MGHWRDEAHVPHFVEKECPAVRLLKLAVERGGGAGERPLLVAEQLALDQGVGNRRAVHADERPLGAPAQRVDEPGGEFLARACLTHEQDVTVAERCLAHLAAHLPHGRTLADERAREIVGALRGHGHQLADSREEGIPIRRPVKVVRHSAAERADGAGLRFVAGEDQDRNVGCHRRRARREDVDVVDDDQRGVVRLHTSAAASTSRRWWRIAGPLAIPTDWDQRPHPGARTMHTNERAGVGVCPTGLGRAPCCVIMPAIP